MKSEAFTKLAVLLYGITPKQAIEKNICIGCKNTPRFKTEVGKKEYQITALCEYCWDEITAEED